ncbi:MAG: NAD(+)/NADH kinase [Dehalococcoidia bacterium]|nr:NAD(+)/NADH kinase [Dehalococcoidia bacterium]MDZ4247118.1 NAD(+)/NADH kinase [Dehalococcoidia bacterium]
MKKIGIVYHPLSEAAMQLIARLESIIKKSGASCWTCSSWEIEKSAEIFNGTELVLSLGGDGTMLRSARAASPGRIPILGINLGKLGFMTQLNPDEALEKLPSFIAGKGYIEERAMLHAEHIPQIPIPSERPPGGKQFRALNDVIVGRGLSSRAVVIQAAINGKQFNTYQADALIIATATGSTAYSLAAGGPILHPEAKEMLLQPVAAHLNLNNALVLPPDTIVELTVLNDRSALLGIDGQVDIEIQTGDKIMVKRSESTALFLSDKAPAGWYGALMEKLQRKNIASHARKS